MREIRKIIRKVPVVNHLLRDLAFRSNRIMETYRFRKKLAAFSEKKIVIGAEGRYDLGWLPTDIDFLNLLKPADWDRLFYPSSLDAILAEHVWEHLTQQDGLIAAKTCFRYLKHNGYMRVAVPDGLHPDPGYRDWVRVGGREGGLPDHKVLYTYRAIEEVFENAGFKVVLYEYFDEAGNFHYREWDPQDGKIYRSKRFDKRNTNGTLNYTSIVLDAIKEEVASFK
jgi:predicted SAM-dependent methyltransferase